MPFNLKSVWFTRYYLFSTQTMQNSMNVPGTKQCWIIYLTLTDEKGCWLKRPWLGWCVVGCGDVQSSFREIWESSFRKVSMWGYKPWFPWCSAWSRLLRHWGTQEHISSGKVCISLESTCMLGKIISKFFLVHCGLTQADILSLEASVSLKKWITP